MQSVLAPAAPRPCTHKRQPFQMRDAAMPKARLGVGDYVSIATDGPAEYATVVSIRWVCLRKHTGEKVMMQEHQCNLIESEGRQAGTICLEDTLQEVREKIKAKAKAKAAAQPQVAVQSVKKKMMPADESHTDKTAKAKKDAGLLQQSKIKKPALKTHEPPQHAAKKKTKLAPVVLESEGSYTYDEYESGAASPPPAKRAHRGHSPRRSPSRLRKKSSPHRSLDKLRSPRRSPKRKHESDKADEDKPPVHKTKMCRYGSGACLRGEWCTFMHDASEKGALVPALPRGLRYREKCRFFFKKDSGCTDKNCGFVHEEVPH